LCLKCNNKYFTSHPVEGTEGRRPTSEKCIRIFLPKNDNVVGNSEFHQILMKRDHNDKKKNK